MAKYQRISPVIVEATQYGLGMEDGVSAYELFTNRWIGMFDKGEPYPKVNLKPYRYDHHGDPEEFNWGDYLVSFENKSVGWIRKEDFERDYVLTDPE